MPSDATPAAASANSIKEELPSSPRILIKEAMAMAEATKQPEKEMVTPKSENSILKQPTFCPPAPRKLQPVRRKALTELSLNRIYAVRRDLSSVFVKLPTAGPPKKRIRLF
ncbi:hypothetical protein M5K25_006108 [Dendrobium thyrsiflorum]|uniref:Uncharacterized protein n=1 Tax=Dendrobium thyrsiflorum TaxID=117978 RepID=A0ABD0VAZ7_DENTH